MKRLVVIALVVMATVAAVSAQSGAWTRQASDDGRFSIAAPCTLQIEKGFTPRNGDDPSFNSFLYICSPVPVVGEMYLGGWVEYEAGYRFGDDAELKANRDNLIKGVGGTLLTSGPVTYAGRTGIEFTVNVKGANLITSRAFIVGLRPYQIAIMTPIGQDRSENIRRFLDSLRLPSP